MSFSFPDFQLLADGRALVIGMPQSFDLLSEIRSAKTIRLGTAFAHPSGWEILAPAISDSKAKTFLLTGMNFFQTDPKVLRKWLQLSKSGRVEAKLHMGKNITFHPKVLLIEGHRDFAIVGSGNLSRGGLHGNVECAVFVKSGVLLRELRGWFDDVFSSKPATTLEDRLVLNYERCWKPYRKPANALHKQQQKLEDDFVARTTAVQEAHDYLEFRKSVDQVVECVKHISLREWPEVPLYLTVDHFWHWLVKEWDRQGVESIQSNPKLRTKRLPELFAEYARWDKRGERPYRQLC